MRGLRCVPLILTTFFLIIYFISVYHSVNYKGFDKESNNEIVAYSLLKQIELEGQEFFCDKFDIIGGEEDIVLNRWRERILGIKQELFIYGVYRDDRLKLVHYVRILGMIKGNVTQEPIYCQILHHNGERIIVKATILEIWSKAWNHNDPTIYYRPVLISCLLKENKNPTQISLNQNPCKLQPQRFTIDSLITPKKLRNFTICVKPLDYNEDISNYLLQWIAMNEIFGCEKFDIYLRNISSKTIKILQQLPKVCLHTFHEINNNNNSFEQKNKIKKHHMLWQKRRYDIIALNDCLYRNINSSHFIIPVDIDELIVPRHGNDWSELFPNMSTLNYSSYTVRNSYFFDRQPQQNGISSSNYIKFFKNFMRSDFSPEGESGKSFIVTHNTLTVFNHYSLDNLSPENGKIQFLSPNLVQMNHYKKNCDTKILPECAKYLSSPTKIFDNFILKYEKKFYEKYNLLKNIVGLS